LSPAAKDFKILNFLVFFFDKPFVSLAISAKPSNAVLLDSGFFVDDKTFFEQTLFKEFNVEIFSSGKLKLILFIIFIAFWYLMILNI